MNNSKEIEIKYTNWDADAIILDIARHINNGFSLIGYNYNHSHSNGLESVFRLVEKYKYKE